MPATPTIYDALRASHETQRQLCLSLVRTGAKNPARRREVFTALRIELAAHAAAEERYLYVPMMMLDAGLDSARHALSEHHQMDELVEDLQSLEPDGDAWGAKALELSHKVRHHLKEEETKFFQVSGKLLSSAQKTALAAQYQADFERMKVMLAKG
ncbi:MAG: hemerythrin domain-containing protein [Rubrivivax sp.]